MTDDTISSINPAEIQEIVSYITKIKEFDRSNFVKLQQINDLIWGILFIIGGVLDYLFSLTNHPSFSAVPWALVSIGGMSVSIYINTRKSKEILTQEVEAITDKMKGLYRITTILTIVSWIVLTVIVSVFDLLYLVIPLVSFLIGSTILAFNTQSISKMKWSKFYDPRVRLVFLPSVCYFSAIVNLVGYFINPLYINSMGIVMGFLLGFGFGSGAFLDRD